MVIGTWLFKYANPSDGVQDLDNQSSYVVDTQEEREDVALKIGTTMTKMMISNISMIMYTLLRKRNAEGLNPIRAECISIDTIQISSMLILR